MVIFSTVAVCCFQSYERNRYADMKTRINDLVRLQSRRRGEFAAVVDIVNRQSPLVPYEGDQEMQRHRDRAHAFMA